LLILELKLAEVERQIIQGKDKDAYKADLHNRNIINSEVEMKDQITAQTEEEEKIKNLILSLDPPTGEGVEKEDMAKIPHMVLISKMTNRFCNIYENGGV
jgi:hypothetical protein